MKLIKLLVAFTRSNLLYISYNYYVDFFQCGDIYFSYFISSHLFNHWNVADLNLESGRVFQ